MKKLIWFAVGLTSSQLLAAQTINLECVLAGSYHQYKGGKLVKEMSCDHTKEKCVGTYHVSIQPIGVSSYKLTYSSKINSWDKGEIDPIESAGQLSESTATAYWRGNVFIAAYTLRQNREAFNGGPEYMYREHDTWEINRMTGAVSRHNESSITPAHPERYTYRDKSTGTCKSFTPKF